VENKSIYIQKASITTAEMGRCALRVTDTVSV